MPRHDRRYAYGPYTDGPDPLAPPVDLRAALDADRPRRHGGLLAARRAAGAAAPRHGGAARPRRPDPPGVAAAQPAAARQPARRHPAGGPRAAAHARWRPSATRWPTRTPTTPASARCSSTRCPSDTGGAVRELDRYDWRSAEAREAYEEIRDLLGREMLDQRFAGHEAGDAERRRPGTSSGSGRCSTTSTPCSRTTPQGQDTPQQFDQFMAQARRVLPGEPAEHRGAGRPAGPAGRGRAADAQLDERRAARRAGGALPAGVRRPAAGPGAGPARRAAAGPAAGGGLDVAGPVPRRQPDGHGRGHPGDGGARASSTRWPSSWRRATRARRWRTSTSTRSRRQLGEQARVDARALAELERELERQGLFERAPDGSLRLSPKALRRLGESALRDVVDRLGSRRGERETRRSGRRGRADRRDAAVGVRRHRGLDVPRTLPTPQLRRAGGDDAAARRHRRRDRRDRAAQPGRGGAVRRHVVVDGAGRALGADEAHRAGPAPADLHPVPRRRR